MIRHFITLFNSTDRQKARTSSHTEAYSTVHSGRRMISFDTCMAHVNLIEKRSSTLLLPHGIMVYASTFRYCLQYGPHGHGSSAPPIRGDAELDSKSTRFGEIVKNRYPNSMTHSGGCWRFNDFKQTGKCRFR